MIEIIATLKKFDQQGEKTGWTYLEIPEETALKLVPENKKAFRVKGFLDNFEFSGISLIPMGGGDFIFPVKAEIRKAIGKSKGAAVKVKMEVDKSPVLLSSELLDCLSDEPVALAFFNKLPPSHRNYYSKWIESAKTDETKAKRITQTVMACSRKQHYGEMMQSLKNEKDDFLR